LPLFAATELAVAGVAAVVVRPEGEPAPVVVAGAGPATVLLVAPRAGAVPEFLLVRVVAVLV